MGIENKLQKSGVIYRFKCPHVNCSEKYIGESGRSFGDRLKEHLRAPSPIHHHSQVVTRNIKEAMYIGINDPPLNRNIGKFNLPHI